MQIQAAIVRQPGAMARETLELSPPRDDEVLVRMVATGVCHSDISVMNAIFPPAPPAVLGHEGAGVVEAVGGRISHVVPGDHVVLTFNSCGTCWNCTHGHPAVCEAAQLYNLHGRRPDGSCTLHAGGEEIGCCFFGQSSFATYAIGNARNTVKVRRDAPLEMLGPLGCGLQTGAGAILNVLKPEPDATVAIFGCGGVGLAAVMGAKLLGCATIVAVDRDAARLALARSLGATHTVDAGREDAGAAIAALGGAHVSVEATGVPEVLAQAVAVLRNNGRCGVLGAPKFGATLTVDIYATFIRGCSVIGIVEGDSEPHSFIPYLVDEFLAGRFPIDRLVRIYDFTEIGQVMADFHKGEAIKPVLRF